MRGQTFLDPQAKARGRKPCDAARPMMFATARSRAPSAMTPMWQEADAQYQYAVEKLKEAREADMTVSEVVHNDAASVALAASVAKDAWDVAEKAVVRAEETIQLSLAIQKTSQKRRWERARRHLPPPSLKVRFRARASLARLSGLSVARSQRPRTSSD